MKLPNNVDKSRFFPGTYVAYDGLGHVWHVRRAGRLWRAVAAPNNPARTLGRIIEGTTLSVVADALWQRRPARVVEPF